MVGLLCKKITVDMISSFQYDLKVLEKSLLNAYTLSFKSIIGYYECARLHTHTIQQTWIASAQIFRNNLEQ